MILGMSKLMGGMGHSRQRALSAGGCLGGLLREAQQVKEGDGKRGKREERGSPAYEDIDLAGFFQKLAMWQDVVVDRGRDQGKIVGHSGEACGGGKRRVHESLMSVSSIALNVHPSDTSAIATATTTTTTNNNDKK